MDKVKAQRRVISGFFVTLHRLCNNGFLEQEIALSSIGKAGVGFYVGCVERLERLHEPGGDPSTAAFCRAWLRSQDERGGAGGATVSVL